MKEIVLKSTIEVIEDLNELSEQERTLLLKVHEGFKQSYAPYSKFYVSAALLLENGEFLVGSNQENASYPLCMCAERVALYQASSVYPGVSIKMLAVKVNNPKKKMELPIPPCGACRQVICEYENRFNQDIKIYLQGDSDTVYRMNSGKQLLPLQFDSSFLKA